MNKLTPREPTPEMVEAAFKTLVTKDLSYAEVATGVWRAMHDAAPSVPSVEQELLDERAVKDALEVADDLDRWGSNLSKGEMLKLPKNHVLEMARRIRAAIARAKEHT